MANKKSGRRAAARRTEKAPGDLKQGRWRLLAFGAVVVGVLAAATLFLRPVFWGPGDTPAVSEGPVITIQADMQGFQPDTVQAKVGQPVTLRLVSLDNQFHTDGGGKHQFAIDELGINLIAPPLGEVTTTLTPQEEGIYTFYCDICCGGKQNPTMSGRLIVGA